MAGKRRSIITIVGLKQARNGFTFLHEGPAEDCKGCEFFGVCMKNLEPGRVYEVTAVRDKVFPCRIHDEGTRVVEVVESDIDGAMEARLAFQGGIITFQPQVCENVSCRNNRKCVPNGLRKGDRCKILEVDGQTECPLKKTLVFVVLRRLA